MKTQHVTYTDFCEWSADVNKIPGAVIRSHGEHEPELYAYINNTEIFGSSNSETHEHDISISLLSPHVSQSLLDQITGYVEHELPDPVLPPEATLQVKLLNYTSVNNAILAAKLCYHAGDVDTLLSDTDLTGTTLSNVVSRGHTSVLEHINYTFAVQGVSRALTHQLVRHRLASYSQQSQRYVKQQGFKYIIPESIRNTGQEILYTDAMQYISRIYDQLLKSGVSREDARYILPNATETKIIITMNARELLHFIKLRSCNRAQWEIRRLSDRMLQLVYPTAPEIFANAGPACVSGHCTEREHSCGLASRVKQHIRRLVCPAETVNTQNS